MKKTAPCPAPARRLRVWLLVWVAAARWCLAADAATPQRVISLAPNITETVFALGAGDRLVGVGDFCNYPQAVESIQRCGGTFDPNFEIISSLEPDLILVQGEHRPVRDFARERGIRLEGVNMDSIATLMEGIEKLGRVLDRGPRAEQFVQDLRAQFSAISERIPDLPPDRRPSVLISIGRASGKPDNIMTAHGGSFIDEAVTMAGGRNVFGDLKHFYPQISHESLIARRPQVILEFIRDPELSEDRLKQVHAEWQSLASLPAVKQRRIHVITEDYALIPGPRMVLLVRKINEILYPEQPAAPSESK